MDELNLFRDFRRGVTAPTGLAQRRASEKLARAADRERRPGARVLRLVANRPRSSAVALTALTCAIVAALFVSTPWSSSPGFLERAQAALTPPAGSILHVKWELTSTSTDPACRVEHSPSEIWIDQTPPHRYRVLMHTLPPPDASDSDPRSLACSNWNAYELGGALDSGETLRFESPNTLRLLPGSFSHPIDPVTDLRESISAGSAHDEGRTQFEGRVVQRIRVDPESTCAFPACPREPFYWYVDPKTYYPIAAEGGGGIQAEKVFVPLDVVVRYLAYEHLPRTAANLALTDIRAQHPDATDP
jgi:hypothetical protein